MGHGKTIEKRIGLSPTPRVAACLRELSELTGKPVATIVREMLEEAAPVLESTIQALRLVKTKPRQAVAAMDRVMTNLVGQAQQAQLDLDKASRLKPGRKPSTGEGGKRRRDGGPPSG
jgi:predicted DNA-binding protein